MKDLSSNNLVGKVEKNPKWTAGKVKGALEFTDVKNQGVLVKHNDVWT